MADEKRSPWPAVGAIGALMGGAAALIAVLYPRETETAADVEIATPVLPAISYAEAFSCYSTSRDALGAAEYLDGLMAGSAKHKPLLSKYQILSVEGEAAAERTAPEPGAVLDDVVKTGKLGNWRLASGFRDEAEARKVLALADAACARIASK